MNPVSCQFQRIPQDYEKMMATNPVSFKFLGLALNEDAIRKVPLTTKVILRRAGGDEDFTRNPTQEGIDWANETFSILTPYLKIRPDAIVETINEPNPTVVSNGVLDYNASVELSKKLNEYQVSCANRLHQLGVSSVGAYQFSVGQPPCRDFNGDQTLWPFLLDGVRASDYLFVHEYSAPTMSSRGEAYCLRIFHVLAELRGYGVNPRVGITECGIDFGVINGQLGGYKTNGTTIQAYIDQLRWYTDSLVREPNIEFAHVFLCGRSDDHWATFDVADDDFDRAQFIEFLKYQPNVQPPQVEFKFTHYPLPHTYVVTQGFGENPANYAQFGLPGHEGIDLGCPTGTPVLTVADGTVAQVGNDPNTYGNFIRINHLDNWQTTYAHLQSTSVSLNQIVKSGDQLGISNATGNVTGPHLHLTLKHLNHTYTDANGVVWPYNIFDPTTYLQAVTGETMITSGEIAEAIPYLIKQGIANSAGQAIYGERDVHAADGKLYHLYVFEKFGVGTEDGKYGPNDAFYFDNETFAITATPPVVVPPVIPPATFVCPDILSSVGAFCEQSTPISGQKFYRLNGATVNRGVSAFAVITVLSKNGAPVIGAKVVNQWRGSTNGEVILTDSTGTSRFQFGASSAFSNPNEGPFSFAVSANATKDTDVQPPVLHIGTVISDWVRSVGDFQGIHQETYLQFVEL